MKIEKKIVKGSPKLSLAAKSAIAASFGIATIAFTACEESGSVAAPENPDLQNPDTKGPETENPSSSSKVVDIPLSHKALSSEAQEALSSAAQDALSSAAEEPFPPPEAGVIPPDEDIYGPKSSSSEVTPPSSSSYDEPYPPPEAGVIPPDEDILEDNSSSSTEIEQSESSSSNEVKPILDSIIIQDTIERPNIFLCTDKYGCDIVSMVTTYEPGDIRA